MTKKLALAWLPLVALLATLVAICSPPAQAATPITVSGTITDEHGDPVAGAKIRAFTAWGRTTDVFFARTTSDAAGHFSFSFDPKKRFNDEPVWADALWVTSEDHWTEFADIPDYQPGDSVTVDVEMLTKGTVGGTVLDDAGTPIAGAEVRLHNVFSEFTDCDDDGYCPEGLWYDDTLTTGADGTFSRQAHPHDLIGVVVTAPGFAPEVVYDARVDDHLALTLRPGDPEFPPATVTGTLRDSSGAPIAHHVVRLESDYDIEQTTETGADGGYAFEFAPLDVYNWSNSYAVAAYDTPTHEHGRTGVAASLSGYYEPGSSYAADLTLVAGATLEGQVVDTDGLPLAGVLVDGEVTTDADGHYTLNTWSGLFAVTYELAGYADDDDEYGTVAPGETKVLPVHVMRAVGRPGAMTHISIDRRWRHRVLLSGSVPDDGGLFLIRWFARCRGGDVPVRTGSAYDPLVIVRGLVAGHRYHCQLRVSNGVGKGPWSEFSAWFRTRQP